jgi:hypothetical protein
MVLLVKSVLAIVRHRQLLQINNDEGSRRAWWVAGLFEHRVECVVVSRQHSMLTSVLSYVAHAAPTAVVDILLQGRAALHRAA